MNRFYVGGNYFVVKHDHIFYNDEDIAFVDHMGGVHYKTPDNQPPIPAPVHYWTMSNIFPDLMN